MRRVGSCEADAGDLIGIIGCCDTGLMMRRQWERAEKERCMYSKDKLLLGAVKGQEDNLPKLMRKR